jgi:peptidoglycan/xylan/chitin deacetylase (PgdA/CDA1 family)
MKLKNNTFLLTPAHLTCIGAIQISITLLFFFNIYTALIPLYIFLIITFSAPFFPTSQYFLPLISHGNRKENKVTLTFDDGPDPYTTIPLLNLLDKYNVKACFFVIGEKAQKNEKIIKKNNATPLCFRPPRGITNPRLWPVIHSLGLDCINFSNRGRDFGNRSIKNLSARILKKIKNGDIILLHDNTPNNEFSLTLYLSEIELIIKGIQEINLSIVSLSENLHRPVTMNSLTLQSV